MEGKRLDEWKKKRQERQNRMTPSVLFSGIQLGDLVALSEGITLIESHKPEHRKLANELIQLCLPLSGNSIRVGITGVPGVGKSTFIESFGKTLVNSDKKVAVLAVDPSSGVSGGSILGDKTRMNELSVMENVFIRPSAAGETLGGVARKTRESIILCEAAGFDFIVVETVGVGQSETVVKSMVDFFLLLMLAGAGDELQGIKKGIMEMADALVITKADGDNIQKAKMASREYKNALHLFPPNANDWIPKVFTCSSLTGENIGKIQEVIESFENHTRLNGWFTENRKRQDKKWLSETLKELILNGFLGQKSVKQEVEKMEEAVMNGELSSFLAAENIYKKFSGNGGV